MLTQDVLVERIRNTRAAGPMVRIEISLPIEPLGVAPLNVLAATAAQDSLQYCTVSYWAAQPHHYPKTSMGLTGCLQPDRHLIGRWYPALTHPIAL